MEEQFPKLHIISKSRLHFPLPGGKSYGVSTMEEVILIITASQLSQNEDWKYCISLHGNMCTCTLLLCMGMCMKVIRALLNV